MGAKLTIFIIVSFMALDQFAQNSHCENITSELKFISHLYMNHYYNDAIFVLKNLDRKAVINCNQKDSVYFFMGKSFYKLHLHDSSIRYLNAIEPDFNKYLDAQFLNLRNFASLKKYKESMMLAQSVKTNDIIDNEIKWYSISSVLLLQRNLENYSQIRDNHTFYVLGDLMKKNDELYDKLYYKKPKSPFIAASLSAVIPGLGKMYANKPMEGISSFLITSMFAVFAYESIKKHGISDFKSIFFTSVFSFFYIGNIWGSVFAIKRSNTDFNNVIDHEIQHNLQLSIDAFYSN
nr:hypothetical protein [Bacteroidota bacterium]